MSSDDRTSPRPLSDSTGGDVVVKKMLDSSEPEDWVHQQQTLQYSPSDRPAEGTGGIGSETVSSSKIASRPEVEKKAPIRQALGAVNAENLQGLQASRLFTERFQVVKKLGGGSYGEVFHVIDSHYKGEFALKVARLDQAHDPLVAAREILGEARAIMALNHPGVMRVFEANVTDDGTVYILMQYLPGGNLSSHVKEHGRLSPDQAVPIVLHIARTLVYIHSQGMVHRDLKPDNILFDQENNPLIGDFGLALTDQQFAKGPRFCGTMLYMSPEQLDNQADLVDGRSDIYSLGVLFYELLTGKHPYRSSTKEQLKREMATSDLRPIRQLLPNIPEELARIVSRAAAKKASDRYQTAADFVADLEAYASRQVKVPSEAAAVAASRVPRSQGVIPALLVALLLFAGGSLGWVYFGQHYFNQTALTLAPRLRMDIDGRAMTSEDLPLTAETPFTGMTIDLKQPGHVRVFRIDSQGATEIPVGSQIDAKSRFEIQMTPDETPLQGTTQMLLVVPSDKPIDNRQAEKILAEVGALSGQLDTMREKGSWQEFSSELRQATPVNTEQHRGFGAILNSPTTLTEVPKGVDSAMQK
ncbi:MAG: serine/threonine-protein kinase, partial [Planctomycetota bacterium]|nr:serine/threonine-protein kinase [Planctomycetota bacterium]